MAHEPIAVVHVCMAVDGAPQVLRWLFHDQFQADKLVLVQARRRKKGPQRQTCRLRAPDALWAKNKSTALMHTILCSDRVLNEHSRSLGYAAFACIACNAYQYVCTPFSS